MDIEPHRTTNEAASALRETFLDGVRGTLAPVDAEKVLRALCLAEDAHRGQVRDDDTPYILHPLRIAHFLVEQLNVRLADVVCAALLHDVIEDKDEIDADSLERLFGPEVRNTVETLTKPPKAGRTRAQINEIYFERLRHANQRTKLVKLADKLDNLRDAVNCPEPAKRLRTADEGRQFYLALVETLEDEAHRSALRQAMQSAIDVLLAST